MSGIGLFLVLVSLVGILSFSDNKETQTIFNSAVATLIRLDKALQLCAYYYSMLLDYDVKILNAYYMAVNTAYNEVHPKLNQEKRNQIKTLKDKLKNIKGLIIINKTEQGNIRTVNKDAYDKKANILEAYELKVRELADAAGMLNPSIKQDGSSMDA